MADREKIAEWLSPLLCNGVPLAEMRGLIGEQVIYEKTDQLIAIIDADAANEKGVADTIAKRMDRPCPQCGGEGYLKGKEITDPNKPTVQRVWESIDCPRCNGTGQISIPEMIRVILTTPIKMYPSVEDAERVLMKRREEQVSQILNLFPTEEVGRKAERERIASIIREYGLESASVRDDMLEKKAKGWKLLWDALKESPHA